MKNQQPPERVVTAFAGTYSVHSIFPTIQGEGPFAGTPATFVRLAGCNLQCPLCDTQYTEGRVDADIPTILNAISKRLINDKQKLVVITGGEPFRQPIGALIRALVENGYYVQIETNGLLPIPPDTEFSRDIGDRRGAYIVCSPKTGKVHPSVAYASCCYKYVARAADIMDDGLPSNALGEPAKPILARPPKWYKRPIYLQPADEQDSQVNAANTEAVVRACLEHGYILQLQIHKQLNLP